MTVQAIHTLTKQQISEAIKSYRKSNSMTHKSLASLVGVHRLSILNWELMKTKPHWSMLKLLRQEGIV